jgi:hypothetical protein
MAKKTSLSLFWTFQELRDSKNGKVKEHDLQISRRIQQDEVGQKEVNMLHLGAPHGLDVAMWYRLKWASELPLHQTSCHLSWDFSDSSHGDGLTEGLDGVR